MAISIHNTWLSLRRRRTQKARTPNGRKASAVLVATVRTCEVLKPIGSDTGVETARTTVEVVTPLAPLVPALACAGRHWLVPVVRQEVVGVMKQLM
jgi:hypothetical protein